MPGRARMAQGTYSEIISSALPEASEVAQIRLPERTHIETLLMDGTILPTILKVET